MHVFQWSLEDDPLSDPKIISIISLFLFLQRQKCFGLVNVCYRIGSIVNALVAPRGDIPLPAMICYSSGPFLGAALCLLLPETSGIQLPDTVLDCEKQPRLQLQCLPCSKWDSYNTDSVLLFSFQELKHYDMFLHVPLSTLYRSVCTKDRTWLPLMWQQFAYSLKIDNHCIITTVCSSFSQKVTFFPHVNLVHISDSP